MQTNIHLTTIKSIRECRTQVGSKLQYYRERYRVKEIGHGLGYSAWVEGYPEFGSCWGDTAGDALDSLEWYLLANYGSKEVAMGGES